MKYVYVDVYILLCVHILKYIRTTHTHYVCTYYNALYTLNKHYFRGLCTGSTLIFTAGSVCFSKAQLGTRIPGTGENLSPRCS